MVPKRTNSNIVDEELRVASNDATDPITLRPSATSGGPRLREVENLPPRDSSSDSDTDLDIHHRPISSRSGAPLPLSRTSTAPPSNGIELSRIQTARSQHSNTVGSGGGGLARTQSFISSLFRNKTKCELPEFGAGKAYPPLLPNREDYVVEFAGADDPLHAQNWPLKRKLITAAMLGYTTMTSSFTSSVFSAATHAVAAEFGVSSEVGILGTSLYVLGFAFGPTLWAPFSELKGRRLPLVISMFGFTVFCFACATAKDLQTVMISRFFSGFFGACPLAVVAAVFSDMFDNKDRGIAITLFSMTVFTGPLLAPFIGGFIVTSHLGWRWTQYIPGMMGALAFVLDLLFLPESYAPAILVDKAAMLRRHTKNWGIHAKQDEIEVDFKELISKNFTRPMRILFGEPIVLLLSIYMSFIYGLLYLFLTAYPLVFQGVHHMKQGVAGLAFFGMILGQLIAGGVVLAQQPWYVRKLNANHGVSIPEWRLPSVIAGAVAFSIGLFWFGWTGYTHDIHWIVPTASGIFSGFGLMSIFLQSLNYLVDSYLMFAASAIAGNTFMRSICGAVFPLFATYMINGMGIQWAGTLLGCVAAVLIPIPICFWVWGDKIRAKSKLAPTPTPKTVGAPVNSDSSQEETEKEHDERNVALHSSIPRRASQALV